MLRRSPMFTRAMRAANRDNTKSQTRRPVKPQPRESFTEYHADGKTRRTSCGWSWAKSICHTPIDITNVAAMLAFAPYGVPGDVWALAEPLITVAGGIQYADTPDCVPGNRQWQWKRPSLASIHMPTWAARDFKLITDVRVERVQDISEADAVAEGMTDRVCEEIFSQAAGKIECQDACWIIDDATGEDVDGMFCLDCAKKRAANLTDPNIQGDGCSESDGPAFCDDCGAPLCMSLTQYGIERELLMGDDPEGKNRYFSVTGGDAAVVANIAYGVGDLQDKHRGRMAQIALATLWDACYGKKPGLAWADNPHTWAYSYRDATPDEVAAAREGER